MSEDFTQAQIDSAAWTPEEEKVYRNGGVTLNELGDTICEDNKDKNCATIKRELAKWAKQTDSDGKPLYGGYDEKGRFVYTDDEQEIATDSVFAD